MIRDYSDVAKKAFDLEDAGDDQGAFTLLLECAHKGESAIFNNVAIEYDHGIGTEKNERIAMYWYRKAARMNDPVAIYNLILSYLYTKKFKQAKFWLKKMINNHSDMYGREALLLKQQLDSTVGEETNWPDFIKYELLDIDGQYQLALDYYTGDDGPQDYQAALKWFQKAAAQNHPEAQFYCGVCYSFGYAVPKDYDKAFEWYLKAAEQNNADAQYNLGCLYEEGDSVKQDSCKAIEYFEKSAGQGHGYAQCHLGYLYELGQMVTQDYKKAVQFYIQACKQNDSNAQNNLAVLYYQGLGVKQDYKKAVILLKKSAKQDYIPAMHNLAYLYYYGKGVPQDVIQARKWLQKAIMVVNKQIDDSESTFIGIKEEQDKIMLEIGVMN